MSAPIPTNARSLILREDRPGTFSIMGFTSEAMSEKKADAELARLQAKFPHQTFVIFNKRVRKASVKKAESKPSNVAPMRAKVGR